MKLPLLTVAPARARFNRLRWWWRARLGWPGLLAMLLLLAGAVLAMGVRPAVQHNHVQLLQAYVARLDVVNRGRDVAAGASSQRDPRDAARDDLPPVSRRGQSISQLLRLLELGKLSVEGAEYAAEDQEPGLVRLRIALPFRGDYRATRQLIASVLNAMPNAALDTIEAERPEAEAGLSGHLRFSLYFRREAQ
jgi:hypothetical protein